MTCSFLLEAPSSTPSDVISHNNCGNQESKMVPLSDRDGGRSNRGQNSMVQVSDQVNGKDRAP